MNHKAFRMIFVKPAIGIAGLALLLSGCGGADGPAIAPAGGIVLLDGKAVAGATVTYQPEGEGGLSTGVTDAEGKFTLQLANKRSGAIVGNHKVGIMKVEQSGGAAPVPEEGNVSPAFDESKIKFNWIVPQKLSDPRISGLTATVTEDGENQKTFDLKSK